MNSRLLAIWREDDGVLSFEWTIVVVVIVFGIVGGLAAARDVLIDELGDLSEAVISFDQSFSFAGIPALGIPDSMYTDPPGVLVDCSLQPAGFAIGFALLLLPWILGGGGMGDVKMLAALGAWLGPLAILIAFGVGSIFAAAGMMAVLTGSTLSDGFMATKRRYVTAGVGAA